MPRTLRPLLCLVALVAAGSVVLQGGTATAEVITDRGQSGSVDGFSSWYGSYQLAGVGPVWCIDAGLAAPDDAHGYQPTDLPTMAPATRSALAWLLGTRAVGTSQASPVALALAVRHLTAADYPSGPLDLNRLTPVDLAGFDNPAGLLAEARGLVAVAQSHADRRGPWHIRVELDPVPAGETTQATVTVTDAGGRPGDDLDLSIEVSGAEAQGPSELRTDASGRARIGLIARPGTVRVHAVSRAPDLGLVAYAPTDHPAQRVVAAAMVTVEAAASFPVAPPTGRGRVHKIDALTGEPLAGATFSLHHDTDGDGSFDTELDPVSPPTEGTTVELEPGRYELAEITAPDGYELLAEPRRFTVEPDQTVEVVLGDQPTPAQLVISKVDDASAEALAGAVLDVYTELAEPPPGGDHPGAGEEGSAEPPADAEAVPGQRWVARVTTGANGRARVEGLAVNAGHCVREHRAPPGYRRNHNEHCTEPAGPGGTAEVTVRNDRQPPPTTAPPTTAPPTTAPPTTAPPTTAPPTTAPPTTSPPTTSPPTTSPPTTAAPPSSVPPTTDSPPTNVPPGTVPPTDSPPTTVPPTTASPPPGREAPPPLARTGSAIAPLVMIGAGLVTLGGGLAGIRRQSPRHKKRHR